MKGGGKEKDEKEKKKSSLSFIQTGYQNAKSGIHEDRGKQSKASFFDLFFHRPCRGGGVGGGRGGEGGTFVSCSPVIYQVPRQAPRKKFIHDVGGACRQGHSKYCSFRREGGGKEKKGGRERAMKEDTLAPLVLVKPTWREYGGGGGGKREKGETPNDDRTSRAQSSAERL